MPQKFYVFIMLLITIALGESKAQNVQLYAEDFNSGGNLFILNQDTTFGPVGANRWIINDNYAGGAFYPNTISQDSIAGGGTIAGAPFSKYLHIYDTTVAGTNTISNANFDPQSASDNFAYLSDPICTKAIEDVKLSFFYLCEGNTNAYGEVYYSVNGAPWKLATTTKYFNQGKWKYEVIQNPDFNNVEDLRFGFRWVNASGAGPKSASFAIDDIIVVGTYDPQIHPLDLTVTNLIPNPVCRGSRLIVFFELSDTLCSGTYRFLLSDSSGGFSSPTNLGVLTINSTHSSFVVSVGIPPNTPPDTCYKIRVDRIVPIPTITGTVSVCFEVIDCPNVITTLEPVVLKGQDTICIGSVIDVPFNSTGVYNQNNVYTAYLSDSTGNFTNPFVLGSVPDPNAYPAFPPGSVSGLIPNNVPAGCGYFIRVHSSNPAAIGSLYGPFCIRECDIKTNKQQDISVCINESNGATDTVDVDINTWNTNAQYYTGNQFRIDLHSSMTFGLVNSGGLGVVFDTASTKFIITIPPLPTLLTMGIIPGMYYMRIVADKSSSQNDTLGSLVRLTIGAPSENAAAVIPTDSFICTGDVEGFRIVPYNKDSKYEWQSPNLSNNTPFIWPGNTLLINFTGFAGVLRARVREINFGCYGPWSDFGEITVLTSPDVNISGKITACIGDTLFYNVPFQPATFYQWDPSIGGVILDTTNNEANIVWDSIGKFLITIKALNECGLDFGFKEVTVWPYPEVSAGKDETICNGDETVLRATDSLFQYFWLQGNKVLGQGDSLKVAPSTTQSYEIFVKNEGGCPDRDTVTVYVEEKDVSFASDSICTAETVELNAGLDSIAYMWSTGDTTMIITVGEPGEYTVQLLDTSKACINEKKFDVIHITCGAVMEIPNAFTPNNDGLNDEFGILGENFELVFLRIYNRWGELIFETSDRTISWDGTYQGEEQPAGVYTWTVAFNDENNIQFSKSGNVTLIR
jgi:gliding motility-associated-like protein